MSNYFRVCILWQQTCGENGSCRLYDREQFMHTWLGLHLVYKVLGLLCWLGAILTYKPQAEDQKKPVSAVTVTPVSFAQYVPKHIIYYVAYMRS